MYREFRSVWRDSVGPDDIGSDHMYGGALELTVSSTLQYIQYRGLCHM